MSTPHPSVVQEYAIKHNIKQKEARERLKANYEKESKKVDFRVLVLKAIDGMRSISPKVTGLENRDVEKQIRLKEIEAMVGDIAKDYTALSYDLANLEEIVGEQSETIRKLLDLQRISNNAQLEAPKKTLMEKIRCLLNKLRK